MQILAKLRVWSRNNATNFEMLCKFSIWLRSEDGGVFTIFGKVGKEFSFYGIYFVVSVIKISNWITSSANSKIHTKDSTLIYKIVLRQFTNL